MEGKDWEIHFVGEPLQRFAEVKRAGVHAEYLVDGSALIDLLAKKPPTGKYLAFISFPSSQSIKAFVTRLGREQKALLFNTPLVAVFPPKSAIKSELIAHFDYCLFNPIEEEGLLTIAKYVWTLKQRKLSEKKQSRINDEIAREVLENVVRTDGAVEEVTAPADLYYVVDSNGIIQTINDRVLQILGFSRDEIVGHHFSDLIAREEFKEFKNAFTERRTGDRQTLNKVIKFKRKDGHFEEFSVNAKGVHIPSVREHPDKDPNRIFVGTFGRAIKKSKDTGVLDLFHSSHLPLLIYEPKQKNLSINEGFERYSGYRCDEVKDNSPVDFEKEGHSCFDRYLGKISTGVQYSYTTVIIDKQGDEKLSEVSLEQVDVDGKSCVIGMYKDIGRLMEFIDEADMLIQLSWVIGNCKTLHELLQLTVAKSSSILKVPFVVCAVLDNDGTSIEHFYFQDSRGKIRYGKDTAGVSHCVEQMIWESIRGNKTLYHSTSDLPRTGDLRDFIGKEIDAAGTFVASPLVINEKGTGCIVIFNKEESSYTLQQTRLLEILSNVIAAGIERLRLEEEVRKTLETLESRVRERTKDLEDFVYTVSHDLKSPLHAARGFAEMIMKQFASAIKTEEDSFIIRRVEENIGQALKMIDQLLQLSRIGTRELRYEKVDLNTVVNDYFTEHKALNRGAAKVGILIKGTLPRIIADRGRMVQLFTNVFNNSVKYMNGDSVTINVSGKKARNRIKIIIEDNGIGIHEKDLPNIFNIFYRGRVDIDSQLSEGAGVGLAIVKKIVEQHRGNIAIKSIPSKGTKITLELPISQ
jgi:PAS domain S-box-containing protein